MTNENAPRTLDDAPPRLARRRGRLAATALALLIASALPTTAGDFCVVVCDDPSEGERVRACPGRTMRSSDEIAADFRTIAAGGAADWPFGALGNGFFSFCSEKERVALMTTVVDVLPTATPTRRRQLTDFACMVAPRDSLAAIAKALADDGLAAPVRERLETARKRLEGCVRPRS